jgi:hypothetical protein
MIQIHINPVRVEKVLFVSDSGIEESFDFAAWHVIRPLVEQIDIKLGKLVNDLAKKRAEPRTATTKESRGND